MGFLSMLEGLAARLRPVQKQRVFMHQQLFYSVKLLAKKVIAKDVLELRFEKPSDFVFQAGQFVQFRVPQGDKYVLRSYSISSTIFDDYVEFCVKILPDGKASIFFDSLPVGGLAEFGQARGMFVCPDIQEKSIFVATGTGLAPVISMLETRLLQKSIGALPDEELLFGVRSEEDLFWQNRLTFLAEKKITVTIALSQPNNDWIGAKGRVTQFLEPINITAHYYLCGSLEMVKDVRAKLLLAGVNTKSIHLEIF